MRARWTGTQTRVSGICLYNNTHGAPPAPCQIYEDKLMKKYEKFEVEIIYVDDIITSSNTTPPTNDEYEGEIDW